MTESIQLGCAELCCEITEKDLPLCCPMPEARLWDAHPRVYLALEENGAVTCPYCGTCYVLKSHAKSQ